jgi:exopolyphosphatase/guanosine-5'-triphosphate,3'-diphosphate pyrophosphatase
MRLAVLDIGSNTVHLAVVDGGADATFLQVARERETLRLADTAFATMELPAEAEERLTATVGRMKEAAGRHRAQALVAFATSAIREARNGIEVLGRVRQATGVAVKVLPGTEEARLTYLAARAWAAFSAHRLLVLDIGGGSLEVAGGWGEHPEIAESLPLGATRLTRRFIGSDPPAQPELVALRVHALNLLGPLAAKVRASPWDVVCATSGPWRAIGDVAYALPDVPVPKHDFGFAGVDGRTARRLDRKAVNILAGYLATTSAKERARLRSLHELRAGTVVAASQLAALTMQSFGVEEVVLAPWALREGVIIEELAARAPNVDGAPIADPRRRSVLDFARRHAWDGPHCEAVVKLALELFDQTSSLHGLGPEERELLEYAGLLHDVGFAISQSSHHKHSLYLIKNADLDGFSERELLVIGNVARYHRKALPAGHHADYVALGDTDRRLVRRLGALLRIADGLDLDHFQVVEAVRVRTDGDTVRLDLHALDTPDLNLWASERNADLFEDEFGLRLEPVAAEVM